MVVLAENRADAHGKDPGFEPWGGESRDSSLADERETQNKKAAPVSGAAFLSA